MLFVVVGFTFLGSTIKAAPLDEWVEEEETEFGIICRGSIGTVHFDAGWVWIFWDPDERCGMGLWAIKNQCCSGYNEPWGAEVAGWGDDGYEDEGWAAAVCISNGGSGDPYATCMCNKFGDNCDYEPIGEG